MSQKLFYIFSSKLATKFNKLDFFWAGLNVYFVNLNRNVDLPLGIANKREQARAYTHYYPSFLMKMTHL